MKILILGFDALDIEIVENEGLDGQQQNFYGFIDVSEFEYADSILTTKAGKYKFVINKSEQV